MSIANFIICAAQTAADSTATASSEGSEELDILRNLPLDELLAKLINGAVTLVINLAVAALVFYIGRFIINKIYNLVSRVFVKRNVDQSLNTFVLSMIRIVLYFILIVTVIGILGIETSSFLAIFASAGVAIGMALSGTLQNFAGGVLILLLKPYRIGDYIEAQGYAGTVREIQIFSTIISTPDNKSIIIPNGGLSTGSINNWSRQEFRRVDWTIGISYGNDFATARQLILDIVTSNPEVVGSKTFPVDECPEPSAKAPVVVLKELAASSVDLKVTAWTRTGKYWDVFYSVNEQIYARLQSSEVTFPYPQLDVHIKNENA